MVERQYQMVNNRQFAQKCAESGNSMVVYENPSDSEISAYSVVSRAVLSPEKTELLGWQKIPVEDAIKNTVDIIRSS